ncbi:unnamed protein product [Callosobruchus maculatus]|uniref:THAP-type domain-containing protein n=1 Tax=Callosobruchus maculatus TaxID=64391 RepID=A0A653BNP2_CALMS|nr:unnamed protein product [Callosobruchus maculatus]
MGGCRCSYKNCTNSTKNTENITFFHYPVKQKQRCKIWIENACKPEFINLEEEQLRNKVICQNHFLDKWFPNPQKKRLIQGAIPTLDAGCDTAEPTYMQEMEDTAEEYIESERDLQHGQVLQKQYRSDNINIVPVSDDHTVFILDTDPLTDPRNKIESYTYRNGDLVRSHTSPRQTYRRLPGPVTQLSSVSGAMKRENTEPITLNQVISPVYEHSTIHHTSVNDAEFVQVKQESLTENQEEQQEEYQMEEEDQENELKPIIRQPLRHATLKSSPILHPPPKRQKEQEKDYLRQLKQHSKDIAEIKKMLKQQEQSKMDVGTAVNFLRERLPSTFFTVLCLNMDCKSELSDEDIEFFTTLHKTSPEMYQILIDKYKWNLPSVNVVEAD